MSQLLLNDKDVRPNLFPLTLTRSVADLRVGILTIREKWESFLGKPALLTSELESFPGEAFIISGNIVPSRPFIDSLVKSDNAYSDSPAWDTVRIIQYPWHIFMWNDWAIRQDYDLITKGKASAPIPSSVQTVNPENIFIEEGAVLSHCIINASGGPVYIGRNAEIMEGALVRGPAAICEGAVVKMGARIYGATTIGPYCTVGGEIKNSVLFGYSNKAHDGYLGDSVIGEWCNLGAGASTSNVKNNAAEVKAWSQTLKEYIPVGLKCGIIMGDYSRSAINTSFNTGSVIGVCANVFGEGLTAGFIPSFTWGKGERYAFDKALMHIDNWKKMKNSRLTEKEKRQLKLIFEQSL